MYVSYRLEPTRWTTPCWNTAPKSTSSKPPSVTSLSTSSTLRQVYSFVVLSQYLGRGNAGGILTRRLSTDRNWKIRGDVPGFLRLSRMQAVEGNSMWRTLRSLMAYFSTLICSVSTSNPLFFLSLFFFVLTETSWGSWGTEQRGFHRSGKSCLPWEGFQALKQEPHCFSPCSFVGSLVCSGKLKAGSQVSSQPLRTVCVALVQTGVHNWNLAELLKDFSKLTQSQLRGKSFLCSFYIRGLEEWLRAHGDWCVFLSYEWLHSCFCTATVLVHCRGRVYYLRWWLSFIFQELLPRENCLLMPKKNGFLSVPSQFSVLILFKFGDL